MITVDDESYFWSDMKFQKLLPHGILRYPQVLVFSQTETPILFEISKDIHGSEHVVRPLPGSLTTLKEGAAYPIYSKGCAGEEEVCLELVTFFLRFPTHSEYVAYELSTGI